MVLYILKLTVVAQNMTYNILLYYKLLQAILLSSISSRPKIIYQSIYEGIAKVKHYLYMINKIDSVTKGNKEPVVALEQETDNNLIIQWKGFD